MLVKESLSPETIEIVDAADNAEAIIRTMSGKVATLLDIERTVVEKAVLDRERARTTAFHNGAAIPHCRLPRLKRFGIGLMVLRKPVRWDNEGHAVDTVMMIVGPSENVSDHLRVLANGSQLLDSPSIRGKIKTAPDAGSVYRVMAAAEEFLEQRRSQLGMLRELRRDDDNGGDYLSEVAQQFTW